MEGGGRRRGGRDLPLSVFANGSHGDRHRSIRSVEWRIRSVELRGAAGGNEDVLDTESPRDSDDDCGAGETDGAAIGQYEGDAEPQPSGDPGGRASASGVDETASSRKDALLRAFKGMAQYSSFTK
jgi:hypothetical protein